MAARLKTFVTTDGLTDYVVATSSRPKALAAWGVHQDLFEEGSARETDDPALVAEARARPGEVLRRPTGSRATLMKLKAPPKPKGPSKAELRRVADLKAKIEALEAAEAAADAALDAERRRLEVEAGKRRRRAQAQRDRLAQALADAERALKS